MKYFINSDWSIDAVAPGALNPNNLPTIELDELPAPISYCMAVFDSNGFSVKAKEGWGEAVKKNGILEFNTQVNLLLADRINQLCAPNFKSRADVYSMASVENPLQEEAKKLIEKFNVYIALSKDALAGEVSLEALIQFKDLLYSE